LTKKQNTVENLQLRDCLIHYHSLLNLTHCRHYLT